jgi:SAM-dependent methyltransferase
MLPNPPDTSASSIDREVALAANTAAYDAKDERTLIAGSPHLKHPTLRQLYDQFVEDIITASGRDPASLSVLELGAGDGLGSSSWFARKVHLTAVDTSRVMLARLSERAALYGGRPRVIVSDAEPFVETTADHFDVVCFVSMLHHVPDYLGLLRRTLRVLTAGGAFLTFQDPLRYDRMSRLHHGADRLAYFAWRLTQGNIQRGLKTRIRRLRGSYSSTETSDFEEYHVVRNGVDSDAIVMELMPSFERVKKVEYWSTQSAVLQVIGERLGLTSDFGVVAHQYRNYPST